MFSFVFFLDNEEYTDELENGVHVVSFEAIYRVVPNIDPAVLVSTPGDKVELYNLLQSAVRIRLGM